MNDKYIPSRGALVIYDRPPHNYHDGYGVVDGTEIGRVEFTESKIDPLKFVTASEITIPAGSYIQYETEPIT